MSWSERPLQFCCTDQHLLGILNSAAGSNSDLGVLILVGGPQYRVGSHRQFTLLARHLASQGLPSLRFDFHGMGDSSGEIPHFEAVEQDIAAALDAFQQAQPQITRFVLWGLCDAASAALLYWHARRDTRIHGLCLLNPWLRSAELQARVQVKHYYLQRLFAPVFWRKLFSGQVQVRASLLEFLSKLSSLRKTRQATPSLSYQQKMAAAWRDFPGPLLLLLSGQDFTAKEFLEHTTTDADWQGLLNKPKLRRQQLDEADHTFSCAAWRAWVETQTSQWLQQCLASPETASAAAGETSKSAVPHLSGDPLAHPLQG